jgi:DNA (cytosine-5)-methyltransferase 1
VTPYYYAAFNAIDWSVQAERIGDRKRPLKPKTMERIRYGLETYGRKPLVVTGRYTSGVECRVRDASQEAMPTQPGDASHAIVFPWLINTDHSQALGRYANSCSAPGETQTTRQSLGIVTTGDHHALLSTPFMVKTIRQENELDARSSLDPVYTQTTCQDLGVISPAFIATLHRTSIAHGIDDPFLCLTSGGKHHALLSANSFLTYYYGTQNASRISDPVHTVTATDRAGLVGKLDSLTVDDLTFRMLQSGEIGNVMAFPKLYVVLGTERDRVKQYGNAITPPVEKMIIERCVETFQ